MATWSFVGSDNRNWLWSNGSDVAYCEYRYVDAADVNEFPHPNCAFDYEYIDQKFNGDFVAWRNAECKYPETLTQLRERCGIW